MPFSRSLTPRPTAPLSMTDSSIRRRYLPVGVNGSVGDDGCFDSGQVSQLPCQSIGRTNAAVEPKRVSQVEQVRQPLGFTHAVIRGDKVVASVGVAVAPCLAQAGDLGNQFWHLISHPAEDQECHFCVVLRRAVRVSERYHCFLFDEPAE